MRVVKYIIVFVLKIIVLNPVKVLRYTWRDDFMVWNPAEFGGIEQIVVRAEDVWTPDILLYNRFEI